MILDDNEIEQRMESPLNLLNRLKSITKSEVKTGVVIPSKSSPSRSRGDNANPMDLFMPPSIDDLVESVDDKLKIRSSRTKALEVLDTSIDMLNQRLEEVDKPQQLSRIATEMARVVGTINEIKNGGKDSHKQLVIWQPVIVQENHYETIQVND